MGTVMMRLKNTLIISEIGGMLEPGFWSLDYPSRDVDQSLILNHHTSSEAMQEEDSDNCIAELFGTSEQTKGKACQISQKCWELMTKPGYSGYSLSHEVFYLQIGEAVSIALTFWTMNKIEINTQRKCFGWAGWCLWCTLRRKRYVANSVNVIGDIHVDEDISDKTEQAANIVMILAGLHVQKAYTVMHCWPLSETTLKLEWLSWFSKVETYIHSLLVNLSGECRNWMTAIVSKTPHLL